MSLTNFDRIRTYESTFTDVPTTAWFHDGIRNAYELGIMNGRAQGVFDPEGRITIAETVRLAAILHRGFMTGFTEFPGGSPWYVPYLDYARRNGLPVAAFRNFNVPITRADFAVIMAGTLPDEALTPINRVPDGAIPDVFERFSYGQAVYLLYRAGVLTGSDNYGTFFPGRTLTRAEAATIVSRMIDADSRVSMSFQLPLTAEQVYQLASPAVFFIEVLNRSGDLIKTGSGFFISECGLALTNFHVVVGAAAIRITMDDGKVLYSSGLYDFDRVADTALIQIEGSGFPYLELADDSTVQTGATVFALGSPLGLQASFSRGIVSQAHREVEGMSFIQLDAAISTGSSGGALLDTSGKVIGITTATMLDAQNINLAVPIRFFTSLCSESYTPFRDLLIDAPHFNGFYPAPDFGAHFGIRVWETRDELGGTSFTFRYVDFPGDPDEIIEEYMIIIEQNLFEHVGYITVGGVTWRRYYNSQADVLLAISREVIRTWDTFSVNVS